MDVRGNKVKLDDDTEISYDKCLIATGKPPLFLITVCGSDLLESDLDLCPQAVFHEIYRSSTEQERK